MIATQRVQGRDAQLAVGHQRRHLLLRPPPAHKQAAYVTRSHIRAVHHQVPQAQVHVLRIDGRNAVVIALLRDDKQRFQRRRVVEPDVAAQVGRLPHARNLHRRLIALAVPILGPDAAEKHVLFAYLQPDLVRQLPVDQYLDRLLRVGR